MILAIAVAVGLTAGLVRAWAGKRAYQVPSLRFPILVLFAFVPQLLAFNFGRAGLLIPDGWSKAILVGSNLVLLWFVWLNRKQPGFWVLGAGLLLNFLVIVANGGLMPISPETVRKVFPSVPGSEWQVGKRLGNGKDIVLPVSTTRLWLLSDRWILLPDGLSFQVAFSAGDVLIALGAFWLLWKLGGPRLEQA